MSATQQSDRAEASTATDATATGDGTAPQRFRAATVEEALRRARELLGDDAEIIEANRIRRGGIGGFFATELGVEVLAQSAAGLVGDRSTAAAEPVAPGTDTEHAALGRSARSTRGDATAASTGPVTDYGAVPGRGRAAWRAASAETAPSPTAAPAQAAGSPAMPSLFQEMLERAAADQLAAEASAQHEAEPTPARPSKIFRAWRVTDDGDTPARPSMFDDEPSQDEPSEPVATPVDTAPAEMATSETANDDTGPAAGGTMFAEDFLRKLMDDAAVLRSDPARARAAQPRRRPRSDAPTLPGIGDAPPAAVEPASASEPVVDDPAPTPRPKRATRRRTPAAAAAAVVEAPELPLETAAAADAVSPVGAPHAGALGAIVDQCLQLAAAADGDGPRKVAVAVTMGDGQVVKITIEPSRGR